MGINTRSYPKGHSKNKKGKATLNVPTSNKKKKVLNIKNDFHLGKRKIYFSYNATTLVVFSEEV